MGACARLRAVTRRRIWARANVGKCACLWAYARVRVSACAGTRTEAACMRASAHEHAHVESVCSRTGVRKRIRAHVRERGGPHVNTMHRKRATTPTCARACGGDARSPPVNEEERVCVVDEGLLVPPVALQNGRVRLLEPRLWLERQEADALAHVRLRLLRTRAPEPHAHQSAAGETQRTRRERRGTALLVFILRSASRYLQVPKFPMQLCLSSAPLSLPRSRPALPCQTLPSPRA
eukprot:2285457-Pleurochrysis_carterae.AAC.1